MSLPPLEPDRLDPEQRALYDAIAAGPRAAAGALVPVLDSDGRLAGPFDALLRSPGLGHAVQELGARIRYSCALTDRERESATLYVAGRCASAYELWAHRRLAAAAGLSTGDIEELVAGRVAGTGRVRRVVELCTVLVAGGAVDPAVLGPRLTVEVCVLVGYYQLLARLLDVAGVGAPDQGHP